MTENTEKDVTAFIVEDVHLPVDLTLADKDESEKKEKGTKKFDKLKLSEEEIEERRRSANYMERRRMKKMSTALADLRKCIPQQYHLYHRRMSKIRTLRLAIAYIKALKDILLKDDQRRQLVAMSSQSSFPHGGMRLPHEPFSPMSSSMIIAAYAAHGAQVPKRQLMFSPDLRFQEVPEPRFQTPRVPRHSAYQTPVNNPIYGQSFFQTPVLNKTAPEHTISSPEEEVKQVKQVVIAGYTVLHNKEDGTSCPIGASRSSSCRYVTEGFDGVCPLPEDDGARDQL
nr:pancreas transcription factor 1 subunit alpha-like [Crassostrea gigas]